MSFSEAIAIYGGLCFRYRNPPPSFGVSVDATVLGGMKLEILFSFIVHNELMSMIVCEDPKGCITHLHRGPTEVFARFCHSSLPRDCPTKMTQRLSPYSASYSVVLSAFSEERSMTSLKNQVPGHVQAHH